MGNPEKIILDVSTPYRPQKPTSSSVKTSSIINKPLIINGKQVRIELPKKYDLSKDVVQLPKTNKQATKNILTKLINVFRRIK